MVEPEQVDSRARWYFEFKGRNGEDYVNDAFAAFDQMAVALMHMQFISQAAWEIAWVLIRERNRAGSAVHNFERIGSHLDALWQDSAVLDPAQTYSRGLRL